MKRIDDQKTQGPWGSGTLKMLQEIKNAQILMHKQKNIECNFSIMFESLFNKDENRSYYNEIEIVFKNS
jgi:hypothetical protein